MHVSTVWRWASRGVRGHKLKTWRVGGTTCTTAQAIDEFIAASSGPQPRRVRRRDLGGGW
ncbi:MAG: DUF1580 domain-containing protein [Planctomycetota bacterium]